MEEDNRAFHPSHPFRHYQYRRISKANPTSNKDVGLPTVPTTGDQLQKHPVILGMTAVDDDVDEIGNNNCSKQSSFGVQQNYNTRYHAYNINQIDTAAFLHHPADLSEKQEEPNKPAPAYNNNTKLNPHEIANEKPSWLLEESQKLFKDYERRFQRQSLTEQAKDLYDRALSKAAGDNSNSNSTTVYCNGDTKKNDNVISIDLCSEALVLCRSAIEDQEEASNRNDFIGGSYLSTGDIRLRRKGEGLASKIHCLRAAIRYQESLYEESLEDCEAAIAIWNQKYGRSERGYKGGGNGCFVGSSNRNKRKYKNETSPILVPSLPPRSSSSSSCFSTTSSTNNNTKTGTRARKLSHKHLYLLKARVLAAMGRYREAVVWLTHPDKLPARTFERSSILLESDVAMNRFLHRILLQCSGSKYIDRSSDVRGKEEGSIPQECNIVAAASPVESSTIVGRRIPFNQNLWAYLLHGIDRRLNEGMIGISRGKKNYRTRDRTNSGSAIYQMLRHGPVLFHHCNQGDENINTFITAADAP